MFELLLKLLNDCVLLDVDTGGGGGGGDNAGGDGGEGVDDKGKGGSSVDDKFVEGKEGEKKTHKYLSQFSPEIREKYGHYFNDLPHQNDLAMAFVKATDSINNAIIVPDKVNATPEEIKEFYKKMGIPESAEGYEFEVDEKNEDMVLISKEIGKQAIKSGLTKSQGKEVFNFVKTLVEVGNKEEQEKLKTAEDTLDERLLEFHQGNKDKRDEINNRFKAFLVKIGSKEAVEELKKTGLLYNPDFITRIAGIHKELGDDKFLPGSRKTTKSSKGKMGTYSSEFEDFVGEEGE